MGPSSKTKVGVSRPIWFRVYIYTCINNLTSTTQLCVTILYAMVLYFVYNILFQPYSCVVLCTLDAPFATGPGPLVDGCMVQCLARTVLWDCTAHLIDYLQVLHGRLLKVHVDMPVVAQPSRLTTTVEVSINHELDQNNREHNETMHHVPPLRSLFLQSYD